MPKYKKFSVLWFVNFLLIYVAVSFLPTNYTVGNDLFTPFQSAVFTSFVWNMVIWKVGNLMKEFEVNIKAEMNMMFVYLAFNFVSIWLLARFAVLTGFGVSSYLYVFLLAFVANFVQYKTWLWVDSKKK